MAPSEKKTISLPLGGMHAGGANLLIPEGATRFMQNMVRRPGPIWQKRQPLTVARTFAADETVLGFILWDDRTSGAVRAVLVRSAANVTAPHSLEATSSIYTTPFISAGAVAGTANIGPVTSFANMNGAVYYALADDIDGTTDDPSGLHSFDGSSVVQYPLGGETIAARCLASYIGRLFLGYVKATITNQLGTSNAYDMSGWTNTNTTVENITNGSTITCRVTPTNTTTAQRYLRNQYTVAASTTETTLHYLCQVRNTSPTYAMPVTPEIFYSEIWAVNTAYLADDIRVPTTANGYHYRVTVAGTSHAATEPTWPTTIGTTVTDGTVTWICAGRDALASAPRTIPNRSQERKFTAIVLRGSVSAHPRAVKFGVRFKFGTPSVTTYELHAVEVSYKDGLTDGDLRKANWGQQLTVGKFAYPFVNTQSAATSTLKHEDRVYWTDASDPTTIEGDNYHTLNEAPGAITAMCVVSRRLVVFKAQGIWIFAPGDTDDQPIILEQFVPVVGCKGPLAATVFEDKIYFIGNPHEIYRFEVGGYPEPLGGDAMRGRFAFVASEGTTSIRYNIAVDGKHRDLYAHCGVTESYVLDLDSGSWSIIDTSDDLVVPRAFAYNPYTSAMYSTTSMGTGASPWYISDDATSAVDDGVPGGGAVEAYIEFRPLATYAPRKRMKLIDVGFLNLTTGSQTSQTAKVEVSMDGGATWSKSITFTVPTTPSSTIADRVAVRGFQVQGNNLAVRLYHSGKGGGEMFRLAAADAVVQILEDDERVATNATITATSL
jgi:hypothetical protein